MNWAGLALSLIQLAAGLLEWAKRRNALAQAQQQQATQQALRLLEMTEQGKRLRERLAELGDVEAQALWHEMLKHE